MADFIVSSGQTSSGVVLGFGDTEIVLSGGTASVTTINSGGLETVSSGGLDVSATINTGGGQVVQAGGTATGVVVSSGGTQHVLGTTSATHIARLGVQRVSSGGLDISASVVLGTQIVEAGGTATGATLLGDFHGASVQQVFGTAVGTQVRGGGAVVEVQSGGLVVGATVSGGVTLGQGRLRLSSGAVASNTVVLGQSVIGDGGEEHVGAGALDIGATISGGAVQVVEAGGVASGTTLTGTFSFITPAVGRQWVSGTAVATTITSVGHQTVASGGVALGATVLGDGAQLVWSGGTAIGATVFGSQQVAGGTAVSTTVAMSGGFRGVQRLDGGGVASGTVVGSGGTQSVSSGSVASGTVLGSGGTQYVEYRGTAIATTILPGGVALVFSGGTTVSTAIAGSGALLQLWNGVVVSGGITFVDPGGRLEIGDPATDLGTIFDLSPGDSFDLTFMPFTGSGGAAVAPGNILQVTQGGTGFAVQLDPDQDFSGASFGVASDGFGGTVVVELGFGRFTFSATGFSQTNIGINNGGSVPPAVAGAFNVEAFTSLSIDDPLPPLDPGYQVGVIDPGAGLQDGLLTGTEIRLFAGDYVVTDAANTAVSPAKILLGSGNQTAIAGPGDTLVGGSGNQVLIASERFGAAEYIVGGTGSYTVFGAAADTVVGNAAATSLTEAHINAGTGSLVDLSGDPGNATVKASSFSTVFAGDGSTTVYGGFGDTLVGGGGNLLVLGLGYGESIVGGTGSFIVYGAQSDTIRGNPQASAGTAGQIVPGFGNLVDLSGTLGDVKVNALTGLSTVLAGAGNATVYGGRFDSIVGGAAGTTFIDGSVGGMEISVGAGGVTMMIGSTVADQPNLIEGGAAAVEIWRLDGTDSVFFTKQTGHATINATAGDPSGSGANQIVLGPGAATVYGGIGDDIRLGSGNQYVDGSYGGMSIKVGTGGGKALDIVLGAASGRPANTISGGSSSLAYNTRFNSVGDLIDLSGAPGKATINVFSSEGAEFVNHDTVAVGFGQSSVWGGAGDRIGVGNDTGAGGAHLWGHSTTIAGAAIGFGTNDLAVATTYDTVNGTATVDPSVAGASSAHVTIGGGAGEFDIATDYLFYPFESAATNDAIVATAQSADAGASSVITLPDGTVMTLVGVTQVELEAALLAGTLFRA